MKFCRVRAWSIVSAVAWSIRQSVRRRMDRLSANQILAFYPYFVWYTIRSSKFKITSIIRIQSYSKTNEEFDVLFWNAFFASAAQDLE